MSDPIQKHYPSTRLKPSTKTLNRRRRTMTRTDRAIRRSVLREQAMTRAGGQCEWPTCTQPAVHMAHIRGSGRGGDPTGARDVLSNVACLCVPHHDVLDGRVPHKAHHMEELLASIIETKGLNQ